VRYVKENMTTVARNRGIPFNMLYLNCKLKKIADTEYRLIAQLARELGKTIPPTGLPTEEVYSTFINALEESAKTHVIVLDEIDQLVSKIGDGIIYTLTRINSELKNSQISIVGISNDLFFSNNLDPRAKSSLSEEEIIFPPYNALEIKDILEERAKKAFKEGVLEEGVIQKCAAYAAREHGDARRALELLRVAGEIAERKTLSKVGLLEVDDAQEKIEKDRILDVIKTQPRQFQAVTFAVLQKAFKNSVLTGEVYEDYKKVCEETGLRPLTQRRVSDILAELDMLGVINAKVVSKGRFGRTREINLSIPKFLLPKVKEIVEEDLGLRV